MQTISPPDAADRVLFLVPRWTAREEPGVQGVPFRCLPVAGALVNQGHAVTFVDQEVDLDLQDNRAAVLEAVAGARAAIFWTNELWPLTQLSNILMLGGLLRERAPELPIVVGGTFVTACPAPMLDVQSPVDYFIQGFGERSCHALLRALDGEGELADVEGLVWRDATGFHANPVARRQEQAAENTAVLYEVLDLTPYIVEGGIFGNDQPTITVGTGQGCGKRCDFCYWRNLNISLLPPEPIVELVASLRERYGVRQFHLAELDFFANPRRPLAMARLWAERLPDCKWFSLCSPVDGARLTEADWDTLAAGGCAKLELGTETGSPRLIEAIGKRHSPDDVVRIVEQLAARGIHSMHNIIFGFEGETSADRAATVALLEQLLATAGPLVTFAVRIYQPTPGTPLGDSALAKDPRAPRDLDALAGVRPDYDRDGARTMPWLSPADEREIKRIVNHYLPLAISRAVFERRWKRWLYRSLRALARFRLRRAWHGLAFDEGLYRRLLARNLSTTYRP